MHDLNTARRQARATLPTALGLVLVLAQSASAVAAPGHERHAGPQGVPPGMDSNRDGTLNRSEFEAGVSRHFVEQDLNGDGRITLGEIVAGEQVRRERDQTQRQRRRFERMDINADGIVDSAEFSAMAVDHFDEMDGNGDGLVDASEWRPPGPPPPHGSHRARQAPRTRP
jgi:hypothetical protein